MKSVKLEEKIVIVLISILLLIVIPLVFSTLFFNKFQIKDFDSVLEIAYQSEITFLGGTVCYGNAFSCFDVEVHSEGEVDSFKIGTYQMKYTYMFDGKILEKMQTVNVVDKTPPVLEIEDREYTYCKNGKVPKYSYKAVDNLDGDITDKVSSSIIDGHIVFSVTDSSGNTTTIEKQAMLKDEEAPTILLKGEEKMFLSLDEVYNEPGVSAYDNCDGEISQKVVVDGKVDEKKPGTYILTYTVMDESGNMANISRSVVVEDKKIVGKVIYLTFDDGPSAYTTKLLDILKKYNAKVTFFVTNQFLSYGYDNVILRAYQEGHTIGLHSYSHNYAIYQSEQAYFDDLYKIQEKVKNITGHTSKIIRFPGGSSNTISRQYDGGSKIMSKLTKLVLEKGFRYYDWNIVSGDAGQTESSSEIISNVTKEFGKFSTPIVLQHDIKSFSVDAVEGILSYGVQNGYRFEAITMNTPLIQHRVNN